LIPTVLWLLYDVLSLKNDVNVPLKVVTNEKWRGSINVCLFFYEAVVFSSTYFRFLYVKLN
jgi:hypothetical protein